MKHDLRLPKSRSVRLQIVKSHSVLRNFNPELTMQGGSALAQRGSGVPPALLGRELFKYSHPISGLYRFL